MLWTLILLVNTNTYPGGHLLIVSLLESSSSRNKPPDSCLWLNDSKMMSSKSGSGSGCANGGFSVLKALTTPCASLVDFVKSLSCWIFGCLGVINAATTVVEGCWGTELSQQEKGHGGGGAIISSELDWMGLGTEILEVRLKDEWVRFQAERAGRKLRGERAGHSTNHRPDNYLIAVYWRSVQQEAGYTTLCNC